MFDPARHRAFAAHRDPGSGITSWHLAWDGAPEQRHLYYTNPSISADGRWLWFVVAFPPNPATFLARLRLDEPDAEPRWFPQAAVGENSACICPAGDAAWFCCGDTVWRCDAEGRLERVGTLPADLVGGRAVHRLATHLTRSADGRHLALDSHIGNQWILSLLDTADGSVRPVAEFASNHNHAQFSPHDPDLLLIAHDQHTDPATGRFTHHRIRTNLIRRDGSGYRCINPHFPCGPYRGASHEWWLADGRVAFVDYASGVWAHDPASGRDEHLWAEPLCHAHASPDGSLLAADQDPYRWDREPCQVLLRDRRDGRRLQVCSGMPPAPRGPWHLHPHPQFSPDGRWLVWMGTVTGRCRIALTLLDGI